MSILNRANLDAAQRGFQAIFLQELESAPAIFRDVATRIDSDSERETYNFLTALPAFHEWVDERQFANLRAEGFTIVNKWWSSAVKVKREEVDDDKIGLVSPRIRQLAQAGIGHYDKLIVDCLAGGFDGTSPFGLAYDGQYFFDTDHQSASETPQSNKLTAALSESSYNSAMSMAMGITDVRGEPFNVTPTHLIVGPSNRATALSILQAERNAAGASNVNYQSTKLIISHRLRGDHATKWFLLDCSKALRPVVLQIRKPLEFVPMDRSDDAANFHSRTLMYGADGRHNVGFGLWQTAIGSTGAS